MVRILWRSVNWGIKWMNSLIKLKIFVAEELQLWNEACNVPRLSRYRGPSFLWGLDWNETRIVTSCKLWRCMTDMFQEFKDFGLKLLILTIYILLRSLTVIRGFHGRGENNPAMLRNRWIDELWVTCSGCAWTIRGRDKMYFLSCLHRTKIQTFYVISAKSCYFYSVHLKEMQNLCEIKINILIKQKLRNVSILTIFFHCYRYV